MNNESVLVTGANGFIGKALCATLVARGFKVRAAVRGPSRFSAAVCEVIQVSTLEAADWEEAMRGVTTVFHLAGRAHVLKEHSADPAEEFRRVNLLGTMSLARASNASRVKRFIYVSSIGVNGLSSNHGHPFSEVDEPCPHNAYASTKWEAEKALRNLSEECGMEVVIVRPPLVYGGGAPGNFAQMVRALRRGVPLPLASVGNLRSLVYVGNLVDALITCARNPEAAGQTYLVSDGEDVSTPDLLRRLGAALGHPARLWSCPPSLLKVAGKLFCKSEQIERLLSSLQVDSGKIRRELNWTPPYTLQQGLQETADWYRNTHP